MRSLAITPKQKLSYLSFCDPEDFKDAQAEFLEIQSTLEILSAHDRLQFFSIWYAVGDRKQLITQMEHESDWRVDGWPVLAKDRAAQGDFRGACQIALEYLPIPAKTVSMRTDDLVVLMRDFRLHPTDFNRGFILFETESSKGLISDAMVTLEKISQLPDAPDRVIYEQAALLSRKEDYRAAWAKLSVYISKWQTSLRESSEASMRADKKLNWADVSRILRDMPER